MAGNVTPYKNLITSEHADKPKYMAMVGATCQPQADLIALYESFAAQFDVEQAVGAQLDILGQWVGVSRELTAPLVGVYFAFDTPGSGFDQGIWLGPFDPVTGLLTLPDDFYRVVIQVKALNNVWDGSKEDAIALANEIFSPLGYVLFIEDPADLSINIGIVGPDVPSNMIQALLTSGKFNIKPATIKIAYYLSQTVAGPLFGFDLNNGIIAGFDQGGWAKLTPG